MGEHHTPPVVEVTASDNLGSLLAARAAASGESPLFEVKDPSGTWQPISARETYEQVIAVAKGLVARGIEPGDRVGIMSRTRYEWTVLDFAVWTAGAISVPVYETSSADQVRWILTDADVQLIVAETSAHAEVITEARQGAPHLRDVLTIDGGALEALSAEGEKIDDAELDRRSRLTGADNTATIIYTSGTTGRPKGVLLTHRNFIALTRNTFAVLGEEVCPQGSRTLLFMPLAHVFARFVEVLTVEAGAVCGHTPDTTSLVADLGSFKPTFILSVPRVFEKVYNVSEQKAAAGGKGAIFQRAAKTSIVYSRALDDPKGPSLWLRLQHKVADVLVLHKLREAMGGQLAWAISGGAPLGERLGHFYRGVGLHVLEGYGLTETTAPTNVNMPAKTKIGTVGPPLPGTAIRIAEDGEILAKGEGVFIGYHDNADATAEALKDGWFRTGDLGALDDDGYLRITGRKKEILVTAGGKNVAPAVLEDRLRGHPLISQVVVVGDQRPFIGALITLDPEGLPGWLAAHGKPEMTVTEAAADPDVLASLDKAVERTNEAVSRAESIRKYRILDKDLTLAGGHLTPKLSVKRHVVLREFADQIEELYLDTRDRSDSRAT